MKPATEGAVEQEQPLLQQHPRHEPLNETVTPVLTVTNSASTCSNSRVSRKRSTFSTTSTATASEVEVEVETGEETESTYVLSEEEEERGREVRATGSVTFDDMIRASVATKSREVIEGVRLLLLYGKVEEARKLLEDFRQRKEGTRQSHAVTFGVLGAVGGVAGALTFGPFGFYVGTKLALLSTAIPAMAGSGVGVLGAIMGGVAVKGAVDATGAYYMKELQEKGASSSYSAKDFAADEEFIQILVASVRAGDRALVQAAIVCHLNFIFKSRPSHPALASSKQDKDNYLMILALSKQILEGFWKPAVQSLEDSDNLYVTDAVVFQACEYVVMHERNGYEMEFENLSSKFIEAYTVATKEELGPFRPAWLDTEEAVSCFEETKAKMLLVKSTKSGFEKLKVLAATLECLYTALDKSELYREKTIGADVIFPAVCYLCVFLADEIKLLAELEYICVFTTIPYGIGIENTRIEGKHEYVVITFRAALNAIKELGVFTFDPKAIDPR